MGLNLRAQFNPQLNPQRFGAINNVILSITMLSIILTGAALIREKEHRTAEHAFCRHSTGCGATGSAAGRQPNPSPQAGYGPLPSVHTTYRRYDFVLSPGRAPQVTGVEKLTRRRFLARAHDQRPAGDWPGISVFVHAFNNSFQESLFALAEMVGEGGAGPLPVLLVWPLAKQPRE